MSFESFTSAQRAFILRLVRADNSLLMRVLTASGLKYGGNTKDAMVQRILYNVDVNVDPGHTPAKLLDNLVAAKLFDPDWIGFNQSVYLPCQHCKRMVRTLTIKKAALVIDGQIQRESDEFTVLSQHVPDPLTGIRQDPCPGSNT